MSRANPLPQLFDRAHRVGGAVLVDDGARGLAVPVRAREDVGEVDAEGVFGLADLPLLVAARALEVLAEAADLVLGRLRRRLPRQEVAHPPHHVRGRLLADQPVLQHVVGGLLKRALRIARIPSRPE